MAEAVNRIVERRDQPVHNRRPIQRASTRPYTRTNGPPEQMVAPPDWTDKPASTRERCGRHESCFWRKRMSAGRTLVLQVDAGRRRSRIFRAQGWRRTRSRTPPPLPERHRLAGCIESTDTADVKIHMMVLPRLGAGLWGEPSGPPTNARRPAPRSGAAGRMRRSSVCHCAIQATEATGRNGNFRK